LNRPIAANATPARRPLFIDIAPTVAAQHAPARWFCVY
jgi:hypothetical protein